MRQVATIPAWAGPPYLTGFCTKFFLRFVVEHVTGRVDFVLTFRFGPPPCQGPEFFRKLIPFAVYSRLRYGF